MSPSFDEDTDYIDGDSAAGQRQLIFIPQCIYVIQSLALVALTNEGESGLCYLVNATSHRQVGQMRPVHKLRSVAFAASRLNWRETRLAGVCRHLLVYMIAAVVLLPFSNNNSDR
jgi:hypothetical protein